MTLDPLAVLSTPNGHAVRRTAAALEAASEPVSATELPALADPSLHEPLRQCLHAAGRTLMQLDDRRWITGYDDTIADRLSAEGLGVLSRNDAAVLTLVLLHSVAIPRARGRITSGNWTIAEAVSVDTIARNRHLTKATITTSVRRLRTAGILRPGQRADIVPGPQFLRLSPHRLATIWEGLLLLCRPEGRTAEMIRRRRLEGAAPLSASISEGIVP